MADGDLGGLNAWVDKRRAGTLTSTGADLTTGIANYKDITAKKARLTAINATSYTAARLAIMTDNDMDYAIRLNDDPTSI